VEKRWAAGSGLGELGHGCSPGEDPAWLDEDRPELLLFACCKLTWRCSAARGALVATSAWA